MCFLIKWALRGCIAQVGGWERGRTCGCKRETTLLGPQCVYGVEGMLDFSGISHDLPSGPFFLIFSSLLILVTRGLHREFLSLPFLLASALGKACHVLWFTRRWDGHGKVYHTIEPCRSGSLRSFLHHALVLYQQGHCVQSLSLSLLICNRDVVTYCF